MSNNERAEESDAEEPHKLNTAPSEFATEVQQTSSNDGNVRPLTKEGSFIHGVSPASSSSDDPAANIRRASLPGAYMYRMRPSRRSTSSSAQVLEDASNDETESVGRTDDGPAVVTAQVDLAIRLSGLTTLPAGSIEAEVKATVVEDTTVIEGKPIEKVSELTLPPLMSREKQRRLICGSVGIFAVLLAVVVGLAVHFTRLNQAPLPSADGGHKFTGMPMADGGYKFMGCYKDKYPTHRDLPLMLGIEYNHTSCYHGCRLQGFAYFGLQFWGECHCGNNYGYFGKTQCTDCSESAEFYGENINCVYEIEFAP